MPEPQKLLEEAEELVEEAKTAQEEAEELRTKADAEGATDEDKKAAEEAEDRAKEAQTVADDAKKASDDKVKEWEKKEGKRFNPLQAALEEERAKRKTERDRADTAERRMAEMQTDKDKRGLKEESLSLDEFIGTGGSEKITEAIQKTVKSTVRKEVGNLVAPLYDQNVQTVKDRFKGENPKLYELVKSDFEDKLVVLRNRYGSLMPGDVEGAYNDSVAEHTREGKLPTVKKSRGGKREILGEVPDHVEPSPKPRKQSAKLTPDQEKERADLGLETVEAYLEVKAHQEKLAKEKEKK